eukprot:COSAG01_NODE_18969_length_1039_cov_47.055319_1_plen_21_part_01
MMHADSVGPTAVYICKNMHKS